VTQLVLPLHKAAAEPLHVAADPTTVKSTAEPLHATANTITDGASPTETTCLCVQV
jgi:hypothetical protein